MGSTFSIKNDTDDIIMVYQGADTKVLMPITWAFTGLALAVGTAMTGGALAGALPAAGAALGSVTVAGTTISVTAAAVSAAGLAVGTVGMVTRIVVNEVQNEVVKNFLGKGYKKIEPGTTWKAKSTSLSLLQRAWLVRLTPGDKNLTVRTTDRAVWSGPTDGSVNKYTVSKDFKGWKKETIQVKVKEDTNDGVSAISRGGGTGMTFPSAGRLLTRGIVPALAFLAPNKHAINSRIGMEKKVGLGAFPSAKSIPRGP